MFGTGLIDLLYTSYIIINIYNIVITYIIYNTDIVLIHTSLHLSVRLRNKKNRSWNNINKPKRKVGRDRERLRPSERDISTYIIDMESSSNRCDCIIFLMPAVVANSKRNVCAHKTKSSVSSENFACWHLDFGSFLFSDANSWKTENCN